MNIQLALDLSNPRRWHGRVSQLLLDLPGVMLWVADSGDGQSARLTDVLFRLEKLIYGVPSGYAAEPIRSAEVLGRRGWPDQIDLVIDLSGRYPLSDSTAVLRLSINGSPPDTGAVDAVLSSASPVLTLDHLHGGLERRLASWQVAIEEPDVAVRATGTVLGRAVQLILRTVEEAIRLGDVRNVQLYAAATDVATGRSGRQVKFASAKFVEAIRRRIHRHLKIAPRWLVGWRRPCAGADGIPELAGARFSRLCDDGQRFFADPFPLRHDGRDYIFVEEFPFATERGLLSVAELGSAGLVTPPRPVIETDCHLSYPHLLEHDGVIYMIPETAERRTVELWRATSFPYQWEREAVLIHDAQLLDTTLVRTSGAWYLLGSPREEWTSSWDALAVYTAPNLLGPWKPIAGNPWVVDVRAARSAGAVFTCGRTLLRPVQDCSSRYGARLGFTKIDRLTQFGFAQSLIRTVTPPAPLLGLHTYNRSSSVEVIDVLGHPAGSDIVL